MRRLRRPGTPGRTRRVPGNALLRRIATASLETGAIVMAVVLVAVLIPLAFFGASTYVKSGLAGELQRAADGQGRSGRRRAAATLPDTEVDHSMQVVAGVRRFLHRRSPRLLPFIDRLLDGRRGVAAAISAAPATRVCEPAIRCLAGVL
jgi:hypothetical protein